MPKRSQNTGRKAAQPDPKLFGLRNRTPMRQALEDDAHGNRPQEYAAPDGPAIVSVSIGSTGRVLAQRFAQHKPQGKAGKRGQRKTVLSPQRGQDGNSHGNPKQLLSQKPAVKIAEPAGIDLEKPARHADRPAALAEDSAEQVNDKVPARCTERKKQVFSALRTAFSSCAQLLLPKKIAQLRLC